MNIHNNPMTADDLRRSKGFAQFDERRKAKYSKQVIGLQSALPIILPPKVRIRQPTQPYWYMTIWMPSEKCLESMAEAAEKGSTIQCCKWLEM